MTLISERYEVEDVLAAQEFYHSRNWTDGLPVVPPTPDAVQACLDWAMMPADHLIGIEPVRERPITAEKVAVNAIMAGCLPMHFPVVVAAFTAMLEDPFLVHGATASTGGCAVLVVINGPIRDELSLDGTFNVLGSSDRGTTVIGRAIRLILGNLLDVRPGEIDRSTLGHPGKLSYCIAEDEDNAPWPSLAEDRGIPKDASAVTVMAAGAPRQLMNAWTTTPEESLIPSVLRLRRICAIIRYSQETTRSSYHHNCVLTSMKRDGLDETYSNMSSTTHLFSAKNGRKLDRGQWLVKKATRRTRLCRIRSIY